MTTTVHQFLDFGVLTTLDTDFDTLLDVISHSRRRFVLESLQNHGASMTVRDLTHELATTEHDTDITKITEEEQTKITTSLHHTHIPTLNEVGLIDYREDRHTVALTEMGREFVEMTNLPQ